MVRDIDMDLILLEDKYVGQKEYWLDRMSEIVDGTGLLPNIKSSGLEQKEKEKIVFFIPESTGKELIRLGKNSDLALYIILLAGLRILLYQYTGNEDNVVSSPVYKYNCTDETLNGFVLITEKISRDISFRDWLIKVKNAVLEAYNNQDYPFSKIIEALKDIFPKWNNPYILNTLCLLRNIHEEDTISAVTPDITFLFEKSEDKITMSIEYNPGLYSEHAVLNIARHLANIYDQIVMDPNVTISEIKLLSEEEEHLLLYEYNQTEANYPKEKLIHELFEEQAEKYAERIAAVFSDRSISYKELNEKANQLARSLRSKGIRAGGIVGMLVNRSLEMIVGIMGILKAGGTYLPIDPEYPVDRIKYMLEDSKAQVLLSHNCLADSLGFDGCILDLNCPEICKNDKSNLNIINICNDIAYIIYTSGTTGKPKGVMIEHRNVVRLMVNDRMLFDFNRDDVWTMFHSYCFDFSVWEMYGALLFGGRLVIVPRTVAQDTRKFLQLLKVEKVTVLNQTPSAFFNLIQEELKFVEKNLVIRYVIFGGEALRPAMLYDFRKKYYNTKLINMYGITETTVHVTYKEITEAEISKNISNIGKPIPTLTTYVMDKHLKLLPVGVAGELYVGGDGVGCGYLNQPELTAEKFISNPYKPHEKLYRSGDLVRMLESGDIEYLGRIDHQVKIRGFRIELGEIEHKLLDHESIKDAVVISKEDDNGSNSLYAYLVSEEDLTTSDMRKYLLKDLPEFMIPAYFIQLAAMPLTSNGKVDRRALLELDEFMSVATEFEAPRNDIEQKLVDIWKEILNVDKVGINDNFFELGGHSLIATVLAAKIHKEFDVDFKLTQIFRTPTIKEIAKDIGGAAKKEFILIKPAGKKEYYEVSSAQKRFYIVSMKNEADLSYNIPGAMEIEGELDIERLGQVLNLLVERHEVLRTSFVFVDGELMQKINDKVGLEIIYLKPNEQSFEDIFDGFVKPFNLSSAPLIRIGIVKISESRHVLLYDMHHIISDAVSISVLIQEMTALYMGQEVAELRVQYKDFAAWQNSLRNSDALKRQKEYWLEVFSNGVSELNMYSDYTRPARSTFEGDEMKFILGGALTKQLKQFIAETQTTLYVMLLAIYNVILYKYSGQEDIVVGTPASGRGHADLENMIGAFVNTLPIRNYPKPSKLFREFLNEVRDNTLNALENQYYQFEELVQELDIPSSPNRNPIFDVVFDMQNTDIRRIEIDNLKITPYEFKNKTAKFDITLEALDEGEEISFYIQYDKALFKRNTIEGFARHYSNIIVEVIENPDINLADIKMMHEEEKKQLLGINRGQELKDYKESEMKELDNMEDVSAEFDF